MTTDNREEIERKLNAFIQEGIKELETDRWFEESDREWQEAVEKEKP